MKPMPLNNEVNGEVNGEVKEKIQSSPSDSEFDIEPNFPSVSEASAETDAAGVYTKGMIQEDATEIPDIEDPRKIKPEDIRRSYQLSPSEQAVLANTIHVPRWLSFIEYPFRVKNDKGDVLPEATGWSMDASARGPLNIVGIHVGSCLLTLASLEAKCDLRQPTCDNQIYGMKPSSLLTTVTAAVTLIAALMMPFVGAVVDRTYHRKTIGIITAIIVVITTGAQILINESNWFLILCLEVVGGISLIMHTTSVFSYMPDLSHSESVIVKYSTGFHIRKFLCMTFFSLSTTAFGYLTRVKGQRAKKPDPFMSICVLCCIFDRIRATRLCLDVPFPKTSTSAAKDEREVVGKIWFHFHQKKLAQNICLYFQV